MNLLLDTHVFLWWDSASAELGKTAAQAIANPANRVFVSAAVVWEIAIKRQIGRLAYAGSPGVAIEANGFTSLPIDAIQAEAAGALPPLHQDPFDRILIAQALERNLMLVTADDKIRRYSVAVLWAR